MPRLLALASHLPEKVLSNQELADRFPPWTAEKIYTKTGITERRVASQYETAADLAESAAQKLLAQPGVNPLQIDMLLFVTQTPDQALPTSACNIHHKLGLPRSCGALDLNQGCSGYIYGLAVANGLIVSGTARQVLLLTGDTYTKLIDPYDRSVATLFGDGASATLVGPDQPESQPGIGLCRFGIDGEGGKLLHCDYSGWRVPVVDQKPLRMDGAGILAFTLGVLPKALTNYLCETNATLSDFDSVVFHQANQFILERLYSKTGISSKGVIAMRYSGNTVSSSIPIALETLLPLNSENFQRKILLAGFGVGLSWSFATILI